MVCFGSLVVEKVEEKSPPSYLNPCSLRAGQAGRVRHKWPPPPSRRRRPGRANSQPHPGPRPQKVTAGPAWLSWLPHSPRPSFGQAARALMAGTRPSAERKNKYTSQKREEHPESRPPSAGWGLGLLSTLCPLPAPSPSCPEPPPTVLGTRGAPRGPPGRAWAPRNWR